MGSISATIARMKVIAAAAVNGPVSEAGRLADLESFGSNPGALRARIYIPEGLGPGAALVVVLHGCTQTAAGYDHGSGWSQLADRFGFALLFPEQQRSNNANLCFNWFAPEDNRRDAGEALSIRQMITTLTDAHDLDPGRIFVTGLSAGGAMALVMLATYPDVFAGGAIIAGLPYGSATGIPQALERMRGHGGPDAADLAALVRSASSHHGQWPTISIWHGTADATVNPINAEAILAQWRGLHDVETSPTVTDHVGRHPHRAWSDRSGRVVIEDYRITGMGHGTPIDTRAEDGCGSSGAYMLEANISSTTRIARSWGLANESQAICPRQTPATVSASANGRIDIPTVSGQGVGRVIEDALRAAGLMN